MRSLIWGNVRFVRRGDREIFKFKILVFLMVLGIAAWEDLRTRSISVRFLGVSACIGGVFCLLEGRKPAEVFWSCCIGFVLLGLSRLTDGGIGEGDGWFFIVTGLFLDVSVNLILFLTGLGLCFVVSLPLAVKSTITRRKTALPFIPFLVPAGMWIALRAVGYF